MTQETKPVATVDGWLPLTQYCEITGESRQAVHVRVATGKWVRGVHYSAPDGGSAWVNLPAIAAWIKADAAVPVSVPIQQLPSFGDAFVDAAPPQEPKPTYETWLAQDMESATELYANSVGRDMLQEDGNLGLRTAERRSAKQFTTEADCIKWCEEDSAYMWMPAKVTMTYV